ncbi:unannotated protein [freshwater metagenome]|uniref:Unannotated protein n=1 Tax=freshwater metagenome TaxID=449393 RepID=A0A6J6UDS9_9ZZZZ
MTTCEPGANVVFTHGLRVSPFSTAFLASKPAAIITDGLDVLVQEVIAAITTAPWPISKSPVADLTNAFLLRSWVYVLTAVSKAVSASESATRSCGRFGPAIDGVTVARSSSMYSE